MLCNVNLETHISVVGTTDVPTVEINVTRQHNTFEVKKIATTRLRLNIYDFLVPAGTHFLKATCRQPTLYVCCHITVVWTLVG